MEKRTQIRIAIDFASQIDLYLTGIYIPILFICVLIVWKVKKRGKTSN